MGFPGGSVVSNPPAIAGRRVQSLGREDPLEREMATHSSILAWGISWTKEPDGLLSVVAESAMTKHTCTLVELCRVDTRLDYCWQ